jgi:pimeloyl-ACP methyl ester carboxylesterase
MKKILVFISILIIVLFTYCERNKKLVLDALVKTDIDGVQQTMLIQSRDSTLPVVLFLHGGPGYTSITETHFYSDLLLDHATFVHWDQRGAGYSFNSKIDTSTMTINQLVEDTKAVAEYLIKRFKKDKIYLVGHSWGTVLGTYAAQRYPELFEAYFAMGVIVNNELNRIEQISYMNALLEEQKDTAALNEIKRKQEVPFGLLWKNNLVFHINYKYDSIVSTSKYYSKEYKARQDSGIAFSSKYFAKSFDTCSFIKYINYRLPVYFFQGKYDLVTATGVAKKYFDLIDAPRKEFVIFENSAHLPDFDEPEKFQQEIIKRLH